MTRYKSMSRPNIIAGKYRGKKISVPEQDGLRPTTSRVREMLFNWLQTDIIDLSTLDLFAGSGLLSFEALSRGAKQSTLIEKDYKAFQCLKKNSLFLKNETIKIINTDALIFLNKNCLQHYQLLFIDPPFSSTLADEILIALKNKLSPATLIYIESPKETVSLPFESERLKLKRVGQVYSSLFITS